jgi:hypothetical protein
MFSKKARRVRVCRRVYDDQSSSLSKQIITAMQVMSSRAHGFLWARALKQRREEEQVAAAVTVEQL